MKSPDAPHISKPRHVPALESAPSPLSLAIAGGIIGIAYILYLFPADFLAGTSAFWEFPPTEDVATGIAGLRYYVGDDWQFPIFRTVKIDAPTGINLVFMDALPLLALPAKLLKHAFGIDWNYFGVWLAVCYLLQPIAAVLLLVSLGVRSYMSAVAVAVIALSMPSFLFRMFHVSLCAHFLIMLALSLYFFSVTSSSFRRLWPWFCVLAWMSLWVQAYLFVMVVVILVGTAMQHTLMIRRGWKEACLAAGICLAGSLSLMWISGFFWGRSDVELWTLGTTQWFGWSSMNLLSPVVPQWSGLMPGAGALLGPTNGPYEDVSVIDATGGQYEGFNYLGAGILLLSGTAFCLDRRDIGSHVRKHWGLLAALFVCTALATSHRIYIGGWGIALFAKVPLVLEEIRSSGRLFWPVSYTIMAVAIATVARRCGRLVGTALLLLAVALQVADTVPLRHWARNWVTHSYEDSFPIRKDPWLDVIREHGTLKIFPTGSCARDGLVWNAIAELAFYASASLTPLNTAANDRSKSVDCQAELRSMGNIELDDATLLVVLSPRYVERFAAAHPDDRHLCRSFDQGWVCSRRWPEMDSIGVGKSFRPM